jgi:hypothetical protein
MFGDPITFSQSAVSTVRACQGATRPTSTTSCYSRIQLASRIRARREVDSIRREVRDLMSAVKSRQTQELLLGKSGMPRAPVAAEGKGDVPLTCNPVDHFALSGHLVSVSYRPPMTSDPRACRSTWHRKSAFPTSGWWVSLPQQFVWPASHARTEPSCAFVSRWRGREIDGTINDTPIHFLSEPKF